MIRWKPDTCLCIIKCPRPSIAGSFERRCRIHKRSSSTLLVYEFNKDNRIKPSEIIITRISDPEFPQSLIDKFKHFFPFTANPSSDLTHTRINAAGSQRIKDLKESTRP